MLYGIILYSSELYWEPKVFGTFFFFLFRYQFIIIFHVDLVSFNHCNDNISYFFRGYFFPDVNGHFWIEKVYILILTCSSNCHNIVLAVMQFLSNYSFQLLYVSSFFSIHPLVHFFYVISLLAYFTGFKFEVLCCEMLSIYIILVFHSLVIFGEIFSYRTNVV